MERAPVKMAIYLRTAASVLPDITKMVMNANVSRAINLACFTEGLVSPVVPCDTVETCVGGVCTCQKNYVPPDCCDCEKDLYKDPDGKCLGRLYISDS